jgi:hypothetical protein
MRSRSLFNSSVSYYLSYLYSRLQHREKNIHGLQDKLLRSLVHKAKRTEAGKEYGFSSIKNYKDYSRQVPVRSYDDISDQIKRMMAGETNILWPGLVTWFAKSSGTTADKSKFIPVSTEHLNHTHTRAGWYTLALLYHRNPEVRAFADYNLVMTGSISKTNHPDIRYGDVSAIMYHHLPWIGRPFFTPDYPTSLIPEWDKKIEIMAGTCGQKNVGVIAGVPTWTLVLFRRILEMTGAKNMEEVWPHASVYMHGGVGFGPYQEQFRQMFPSQSFAYHEIYNASEGYFASQDTNDRQEGLLIFPDTGIFYEFVPESQWHQPNPEAISLQEVEIGKPYAMVITTNGGLWRYKIGDTVVFTSKEPYRICITGRTQQYINTFGEEVMVDNTDRAIELTTKEYGAMVTDYTVAPIHMTLNGRGGHHWLIEFDQAPDDMDGFAQKLDYNLQQLNTDYEAKRFLSMALDPLKLTVLPKGTFRKWLHRKGKTGSQAKVPRLSNERVYLEDILSMIDYRISQNKTA